MNRVSSFTEHGLLNRWALNLFSPSSFQELRMDSTENSAFEALKNAKINPYSNLINTSYLHTAAKYFLLTPFKLAYIGCVTLTLSRVGVLVNGSLTAYSYVKYKFAKYPDGDQAWEKTKNYAFAFFADAVCAFSGAVCTKLIIDSSIHTLHFARISSLLGKCRLSPRDAIVPIVMSVAAVIIGSLGLLALQHPYYAPQFFAKSNERVGMYLSLALRKNLGLVNKKGGLLPFSEKDQLQYTENPLRFEGENFKTLLEQRMNAEFELIETVQACNQHLQEKIAFQYPFDGEAIARKLETQTTPASTPGQLEAASPLPLLINKLRSLQLKINFLGEILVTARELTLNDSLPTVLIKAFLKVPSTTDNIPPPSSYIPTKENYQAYFNSFSADKKPQEDTKKEEHFKASGKGSTYAWESIYFDAIDPATQPRPADTNPAQQFKYDLCVNKWHACNPARGQPKSLREMLGLNAISSYQEFAAKKRLYRLAIHPDKNKSDADAEEVSKYLNYIITELNKEYNEQEVK